MRDAVGIVGAGPAGAFAAGRLARMGARVVLFDGSRGREKPCGGAVTPEALRIAPELGHLSSLASSVDVYRFETDAGRRVDVQCEKASLVFSRRDLDEGLRGLAGEAGVELVRASVEEIRPDGGGWEVVDERRRSFRFRWLLGADGAGGLVRRSLFPGLRPWGLPCLVTYLAGRRTEVNEVLFPSDFPGYLWSFPRRDHLSVGICAAGPGVSRRRLEARLRGYIARRFGSVSTVPPHRLGGFIPARSSSGTSAPLVGRMEQAPVALIGDAAALADPLTGEGILPALRSGWAAAETVAADDPGRYRRWFDDGVRAEQTRASRASGLLYRPPVMDLLLWGAERSLTVRRHAADLIDGRSPYRGLRRRVWRGLPSTIREIAGV